MQRVWSADELGERWTLGPGDLVALLADLPDGGKLGLAAQLAYWRQHARNGGAEQAVHAECAAGRALRRPTPSRRRMAPLWCSGIQIPAGQRHLAFPGRAWCGAV